MRCRQARELISLVLDDVAGEYDRNRLELHLEQCGDCHRHREILAEGSRQLRDAPLVEPSANFEWKVQLGIQKALRESSTLRDPAPRPRRLWLTAATSAVAAAIVIVGFGLSLLQDEAVDSISPQIVAEGPTPVFDDTQAVNLVGRSRNSPGQIQPVVGVLPGANEARNPVLTPVPVDEWIALQREALWLRQHVQRQAQIIHSLQGGAPDVHISVVSDSSAVRSPR